MAITGITSENPSIREYENQLSSAAVAFATGSLISLKNLAQIECEYLSPRSIMSPARFGDFWVEFGGSERNVFSGEYRSRVRLSDADILREYVLPVRSQSTIVARDRLLFGPSELEWTLELENKATQPVDVKTLRVFTPFNQDFGQISQRDMYEARVITRFLPAGHGGYLMVLRPSGVGPCLLIYPVAGTGFWGFTFEDHPDYVADNAYIGASSVYLVGAPGKSEMPPIHIEPGGVLTFCWRGVWVETQTDVEQHLINAGNPVVEFVPGPCVPLDQEAKVLVKSGELVRVDCDGALVRLVRDERGQSLWTLHPSEVGEYTLRLTYADHRQAYYRWFVSPPAAQVIQKRAQFICENQFFDNRQDPRHGAVLQWDGEAAALVSADPRPHVVGCCDECGLADTVFLAEKNVHWPEQEQIRILEGYVHGFVRMRLQDPNTFAVKRWVEAGQTWGPLPDEFMLPGWGQIQPEDVDRTFNYVHIANIYYSLYRVGKLYGLLERASALDYLRWAYKTIETMYIQRDLHGLTAITVGHMGASSLLGVRDSLRAEGLLSEYETVARLISKTADHFCRSGYPYGSEQSFDTSGYENIYFYTKERLQDDPGAALANNQVVRIMLAVKGDQPWWHWHGSDVRWWDFVVTGKWLSFDETAHHYMSGLNGWALLDHYLATREKAALQQGYGALLGILTNIETNGVGHMAYHWGPKYRGFDPFTGEIGLGLYGYLRGISVICIRDRTFGLRCYGGTAMETGGVWKIRLLDGVNRRLAFPQEAIQFAINGAMIKAAEFDPERRRVTLEVVSIAKVASHAALRISFPGEFTVTVYNDCMTTSLYDARDSNHGEVELVLSPGDQKHIAIQGVMDASR